MKPEINGRAFIKRILDEIRNYAWDNQDTAVVMFIQSLDEKELKEYVTGYFEVKRGN